MTQTDLDSVFGRFVLSRLKNGQDIVVTLNGDKANLLHIAMGLSGEVAELMLATDPEHMMEEAGDILFYNEALYQAVRPFATDVPPAVLDLTNIPDDRLLLCMIGEAVDLIKKHTIYGQPLRANELLAITDMIRGTIAEDEAYAAIIQQNMDKLTKRYPTNYTDGDAAARKDKRTTYHHRMGLVPYIVHARLSEATPERVGATEMVLRGKAIYVNVLSLGENMVVFGPLSGSQYYAHDAKIFAANYKPRKEE